MRARPPIDRRRLLISGVAAVTLGLAGRAGAQSTAIPARPFVAVPIPHRIPRTRRPMRIGVIGSGNVGGTLGELFARGGHQVMFSDLDPAAAKAQAARVRRGARAGSGEQAIAFADVVVIAVPFGAWPSVGRQYAPMLKGRIVLDPTNPNAQRDGAVGAAALSKASTGEAVAEYLPGAKIVRAFNTMAYENFAKEAGRPKPRMGIPLAANDPAAMALCARLIADLGFDPVQVGGGLNGSARFELRGPASGPKTAAELKTIMGV
jgi:predicted dinucleotide-binding enzyme